MNKPFILLILSTFLTSCNYGGTSVEVAYQNTFSPVPAESYSSIISSNDSSFKSTYDYTYKYVLMFKDKTIISYEGTYDYKNEKFYLYYNGELVRTLYYYNYFQFKEDITYKGIDYTIVWHAHDIFG